MMQNWQSLTLQEQIAQMIMVRASGHLFDCQIRYPAWEAKHQQLKAWLTELNLGGVILLGGSSVELQARSQQLQSWAKIPLFIAADIEEGIGQRFPGGTWFPPPMALGRIYDHDPNLAQQYAYQMGLITAKEAMAVGINWLLAPVVDVNNNPDNPAINIRAFGDRPEVVAALTTSFIQGAKTTAVLTTAKHFPGHGDTSSDSHLDLPFLAHSEARLAATELPPFEQAIAAGVDSVMTAHLLISAWDQELPATLSPKIVTEILRQRLNFSGLVITDALIMGGITQYEPADLAVMAVEAGTDILLMPDDPEVAIAAIYEAIQAGRIDQSRIHQSLERIWHGKQQINQAPRLNTDLNSELSSDRARTTVNSIVQKSLQHSETSIAIDQRSEHKGLARMCPSFAGAFAPQSSLDDDLNEVPRGVISDSQPGRNLIIVDDVLNATYLDLNAPAITIPQSHNYQRQLVDRNSLNCILADSRPTL
ncbi:MAG: glycoside hydrolase family 3 N-terminal domain-containing protein, partial [Cyanobacteria bacterium J06631_6]